MDATDPPTLGPRRQDRRWIRVLLLFTAAVVLVDALIGEQSLMSGRRAQEQLMALGAELSALQRDNVQLRDEMRRLQEDPGTIEYVARKELGLARRGEVLVLLGRGERAPAR